MKVGVNPWDCMKFHSFCSHCTTRKNGRDGSWPPFLCGCASFAPECAKVSETVSVFLFCRRHRVGLTRCSLSPMQALPETLRLGSSKFGDWGLRQLPRPHMACRWICKREGVAEEESWHHAWGTSSINRSSIRWLTNWSSAQYFNCTIWKWAVPKCICVHFLLPWSHRIERFHELNFYRDALRSTAVNKSNKLLPQMKCVDAWIFLSLMYVVQIYILCNLNCTRPTAYSAAQN